MENRRWRREKRERDTEIERKREGEIREREIYFVREKDEEGDIEKSRIFFYVIHRCNFFF